MTNDAPLTGKVAIVTGASAGIGRATAVALANGGASVVATARREDRLTELAAELSGAAGEVLAVGCDVRDRAAVEDVAKKTLDAFGTIDVLVNNAGLGYVGPITDLAVDNWTEMVSVNVNGVLHFLGAVLPTMLANRSGHIVSVGSVAGRRPFPGGTVYAATKFAVRALSWGLHMELGSAHGIRVTDIQPGYVETEFMDRNPELKPAWDEAWSDRRTLMADDIARAILFAVTSPDHVSVSEILVRPTDQPT